MESTHTKSTTHYYGNIPVWAYITRLHTHLFWSEVIYLTQQHQDGQPSIPWKQQALQHQQATWTALLLPRRQDSAFGVQASQIITSSSPRTIHTPRVEPASIHLLWQDASSWASHDWGTRYGVQYLIILYVTMYSVPQGS